MKGTRDVGTEYGAAGDRSRGMGIAGDRSRGMGTVIGVGEWEQQVIGGSEGGKGS